jgi:hypothetical protein
MTQSVVPEALRQWVARDLRPVRVLASPARRALVLAPVGFALFAGVPAFWGFRENLGELGPAVSFGVSALEALAGLLVAALALRESVPGRELSSWRVLGTLGAAAALVAAITFGTEEVAPTEVPAGVAFRYAWECFEMAAIPGLLALAAAGLLIFRALPSRPAVAGALSGLGAGLMADSGARLFCWVSNAEHVLASHGAVILFLMSLGALTASQAERHRPAPPAPRPREGEGSSGPE